MNTNKNVSVEEYFASPRINQSLLGALSNPKWIKITKEDSIEKDYYRVGSAIDCLLTEGKFKFNEQYAILPEARPKGMMGIFIDTLSLDLDENSDIEEYRIAYETAGYKTKIELVIKKLWETEKYKEYYFSRKRSSGKTIISYDEYEQLMKCYENLINNPWTYKYFMSMDPDIETFYQVPIYFDYEVLNDEQTTLQEIVKCKALVDGITVNHKERTVQLWDLKTTGKSVYSFKFSFLQFRYHLQAAFYLEAVSHWMKDNNIESYKLLYPQYIVTEKLPKHSNPAIIYQLDGAIIDLGNYGGAINGRTYKGIEELMRDYLWHKQTDNWDFPRDLYKSEGILDLKI